MGSIRRRSSIINTTINYKRKRTFTQCPWETAARIPGERANQSNMSAFHFGVHPTTIGINPESLTLTYTLLTNNYKSYSSIILHLSFSGSLTLLLYCFAALSNLFSSPSWPLSPTLIFHTPLDPSLFLSVLLSFFYSPSLFLSVPRSISPSLFPSL